MAHDCKRQSVRGFVEPDDYFGLRNAAGWTKGAQASQLWLRRGRDLIRALSAATPVVDTAVNSPIPLSELSTKLTMAISVDHRGVSITMIDRPR